MRHSKLSQFEFIIFKIFKWRFYSMETVFFINRMEITLHSASYADTDGWPYQVYSSLFFLNSIFRHFVGVFFLYWRCGETLWVNKASGRGEGVGVMAVWLGPDNFQQNEESVLLVLII